MIDLNVLKKNFWFILILILAVFLRFHRLDYLELFGDEIDAGYQAYSLMETGRDYKGHLLPFYAQSFSEWRAPMAMYFMIPFIKIFGLNEWGVRTFAAFFGVMGILGFYLLLNKFGFKKRIILFSTLLLAIMPWHILYSRATFEVTLMSSFILWGLYFLIDYFSKKRNWELLVSALLLSLSFYTYNTANVYVPLLILAIFVIKKITTKERLFRPFLRLLLSVFVFSLPILYSIFFGAGANRFKTVSLFNNDEMISEINEYRVQQNNGFVSKFFYNKPVYATKKLVANYLNAFSSDYLFGMGDVTFRHSLHKVGNLFWIYGLFLIVGLVMFIKNKNKKFGDYFWLMFLLISPIPSALTVDGAYHATRLFLMVFPLAYFAGLGLDSILKYKKFWGKLVILILAFEFAYFWHYYWYSYKLDSWRWWHYGYKDLVTLVEKYENDYDKVLIENTYEPALPRFLFWSKYNPSVVFDLDDNNDGEGIDGLKGFGLDSKFYFVTYKEGFGLAEMKTGYLYVLSQSKNVGGDWDWSKNPPEGIKVLETVRNPLGEPLFYLVTKGE